MCGIAGVLYTDPSRPVDLDQLQAMAARLAHRGPDGAGCWLGPGVGFAHRRLAIIDPAGGAQPMSNPDQSVQVVFNGEIYNHRELRAALEKGGCVFRTRSDTEVLVHLYAVEAERLVEKLRGMFAFALWDGRRRRLLLARDRVGVKPLYYFHNHDRVVFASELRAILALPDVPRDLDCEALEDYLTYGMVPGERSIFRGIRKLLPGHTLTFRQHAQLPERRRYWQLRIEPDEGPTVEDWVSAVRSKVRECVQVYLAADVPVGAFLSGGVDSSIVTACAAEALTTPLDSFAVGFAERGFNELPFAREAASAFQTNHVDRVIAPNPVGRLDEVSAAFDEPFADPAALPTFLLAELARERVKVVLTGDGGDEAFGGYARYVHDLREGAWRRRLPGWFRRRVLGPIGRRWPDAPWLPRLLRAGGTLANLAREPDAAYATTLTVCRMPTRRRLLSDDVRKAMNGYDAHRMVREQVRRHYPDLLAGMLAADIALLLPDTFLVKVDRACMAHGLEVRPPLLDHELLELAARIPSRLKVRRRETKWILKEAFREVVPPGLLGRRKQGFDVPVSAWLRGPFRRTFEDAVLSPGSRIGDLIDQRTAADLWRAHLAGAADHGKVLWSLLMLERWAMYYR